MPKKHSKLLISGTVLSKGRKINKKIYIIGAGLSGLSAAIKLSENNSNCIILEATDHAGGRCRSFNDNLLKTKIDNGNHVILGGNHNTFEYLKRVGTNHDSLTGFSKYNFVDLKTLEFWKLEPKHLYLPFLLFNSQNRIPGSSIDDYFSILKLPFLNLNQTLGTIVNQDSVFSNRFWEPICTAVLNTTPSQASAKLLWQVLKETLIRGKDSSKLYVINDGLTDTFIQPAINYLFRKGIKISYGSRLTKISFSEHKARTLHLRDRSILLNPHDKIILTLPPAEISRLLPNKVVPEKTNPIVNIHFKLEKDNPLPHKNKFLGITNGVSQWVFHKNEVLSVTVSDAKNLVDQDPEIIAKRTWEELLPLFNNQCLRIPKFRVIKERNATIAQTPAQENKRPDCMTVWKNIFLAGDWTNTGLPSTIESAIKSGITAANMLQNYESKD